jgi:glycosyltransferase involved in cell wall biosynthesis
MNNETVLNHTRNRASTLLPNTISRFGKLDLVTEKRVPEILLLTSYPPRECGIATYSQDLIIALENKFINSFSLSVCALESGINGNYTYPDEVKYTLDTTDVAQFSTLARTINKNDNIKIVLIQHEFGFFQNASEKAFMQFLNALSKPVVLAFHTVLPNPQDVFRLKIKHLGTLSSAIVVMTKNAAKILSTVYGIPAEKITVIEHGTHLVSHLNKDILKEKYDLSGKKVLSTFGLLSSGKSIETTLDALPTIVAKNPDIIFLIIGKTHPSVKKAEGEAYREMLETKVVALGLQNHVKFINAYLPLANLLDYLQLTDVYLFTSKDPNQAVSGTFSYALSCGCPIISTPIPHAREVLRKHTGILFDFKNTEELSNAVNLLMSDESLRKRLSDNVLQRIAPTAWENSAIAHALLFQKMDKKLPAKLPPNLSLNILSKSDTPSVSPKISIEYRLPPINLTHIKEMTTEMGMIQFSKINQPDLDSGYTIDDNARALIALCMHYEATNDKADVEYLRTYLDFIKYCQQPNGNFLNYVDADRQFTTQNQETNLSDANGRAIWALGYVLSKKAFLPRELVATAYIVLQKALPHIETMHSTRAMAFALKGLYYSNIRGKTTERTELIKTLASRLVKMYQHESEPTWQWFESYLTYGNSILPEALLCAYLETGNSIYKEIAKNSFDFLLSQTFKETKIKVISNKTWLQKGQTAAEHGEQPIDVAYTILALHKFYKVFYNNKYLLQLENAFNWFLGHNHLSQIIYNPCTGGCYDGLEEKSVNLNQGAESTVSYLMARMTMAKQPVKPIWS